MENWRKFLDEKYMYAPDKEDKEETYVLTIDDPKSTNFNKKASEETSRTASGSEMEMSFAKIHKAVRKFNFFKKFERKEQDEFIRYIKKKWIGELRDLNNKIKNRPGAEREGVINRWYLKKFDVFRKEFNKKDSSKITKKVGSMSHKPKPSGTTKRSYDTIDKTDVTRNIFKNKGIIES